jgi:hypothetical protein
LSEDLLCLVLSGGANLFLGIVGGVGLFSGVGRVCEDFSFYTWIIREPARTGLGIWNGVGLFLRLSVGWGGFVRIFRFILGLFVNPPVQV